MPIQCSKCNSVFSWLSSYRRHVREVHKKEPEPSFKAEEHEPSSKATVVTSTENGVAFSNWCLEEGCECVFRTVSKLIEHLEIAHSMEFQKEITSMGNINEFDKWKNQMELETNFQYVLHKRNSSTIGEIINYRCNRSKTSYTLKSNDQRTRLLKSQGSCKMSSACTSGIKVIKENHKIYVEWQKVHYGHDIELKHIRIPHIEKQNIGTKLVNGVSSQRILESVRDTIDANKLKRVDLLTVQDVKNIKTQYGIEIKDGKRDQNDAFSVALWIKECEQLKDNPILLYKEQGTEHALFKREDFCLIIMNPFQKHMLQKFPSTILIDSTHGLNGYDFELTTVMVLDEFHHGFPVAQMFSSRKDSVVQSIFFSKIKETVGTIHSTYFMSDMAEMFFNAWFMVMGAPYPQHLFCAWHVDRAWQSNLSKISDKEKRSEIYKILKVLQQEASETNFVVSLQNAIKYMRDHTETKNFGDYFSNTYSRNFKKWAYCFRKGASINTNMHVESMHKVIKYFYLERKTVKRLDKGLSMVLKYVRDKCVERIIRLSKGENTKKTREITKSHQEVLKNTNHYNLTYLNKEKGWKVYRNDGVSYSIKQEKSLKCCEQVCLYCDVCIHMFSCSCPFFNEKRSICKHIHIVMSERNMKLHVKMESSINDKEVLVSESLMTLPQSQASSVTSNNTMNRIKMLVNDLENLEDFQHLDDATIYKVHQHLLIINNLIKSPKLTDVEELEAVKTINKKHSAKRYIEPQLRFKSNKKKQVSKDTSLKRGSAKENMLIQENLQNVHPEKPMLCKISAFDPLHDHQYF